MASIFPLGPGMWDPAKKSPGEADPIQARRNLAKSLRQAGHSVILMEDDPDRSGEDMIQKFDRLLHKDITDIAISWPPAAKMQPTYDELILLCDRHDYLSESQIAIWLLHHDSAAKITKSELASHTFYHTRCRQACPMTNLSWP